MLRKRGFSLAELMIGITILGIVFGFALNLIGSAVKRVEHLRIMIYALVDSQRVRPLNQEVSVPGYTGNLSQLKCEDKKKSLEGMLQLTRSCSSPRQNIVVNRFWAGPSIQWNVQ